MPAPIAVERRKDILRDWLMDGNAVRVAAQHGIHPTAITQWQKRPWFEETVAELHAQIEEVTKAKARRIVERAQDAVLERLEHGDQMALKGGQTVSVPVRAKDAAIIGSLWLDKLRIMTGKPSRITLDASVASILDTFRAASKAYEAEQAGQVVEGEVIPQPQLSSQEPHR